MTDLPSLQNQFQAYLLKGQAEIGQSIVSTEKVPTAQRLAIYLDSYHYRLLEALGSNFPILENYLGREEFYKLGENYIANHPSPYRSIRWYGDRFADYLKEHREPYLAELAEFEWKMTLSFDAADDAVLQIEQMAVIPQNTWPDIRFKPHASLQRMDFAWNTVKIWEAVANNQSPEAPTKNSSIMHWVLWRNEYINRFYSLGKDEAWALDALIKGSTFSELCEGLCEWLDESEVGMRAASLLKGWIQSGLLAEIV
ncbi:HvfC/BufC N-terminal domain-containing protein [Legionella micdadei]|uniref:Putative DNA-binding domain-containing protein n=1 Tax=Legionella micdadei TaxID=451 RepID=A0A098GE15_LEGMI|nr:putative DNA-binding domain-containing protein [Legionella micdadei]ARG98123.1 DUF2063 domain-containing protein [Legionella micdadei]ARH00921.1 DUF2063 domain-containing protein [Legionella micdadei]KTD30033.1 hypothetical protein Lmic_0214 [Legionella micdadei]NSL18588.1 putative DNA-binding domain-containing protein [Legionella micdadei]CEG60225.1 conserved protein of unknown function [Legionella micdadei]